LGNSCGRKLLREFVELKEKHLQVMRHGLNIIDSTIRMHEIPIVPERIHPIRVQVRGRRFKYGDMSRSILNCLMKFHPDPVATTGACPNFCVNGFRLKQSDTLAELNGKPV